MLYKFFQIQPVDVTFKVGLLSKHTFWCGEEQVMFLFSLNVIPLDGSVE